MSTKTKFTAFGIDGERSTLKAHKHRDWVTISVGIILVVCIIAVVLSAISLDYKLQ